MRYSVCIDSVLRGLDPVKALEKVKEAGFGAYEFWSWWDKDSGALARGAADLGLECAAFCTRMVPLTDPARRDEYLAGLRESIAVAGGLGCKTLISQVGADMGTVRAYQHRSIVAGLRAAAPLLEESGVTLVIEPLNTRVDHAGYYLECSGEGFEIAGEVGSPGVKLLFDIYHQQITEGDVIRRLSAGIGGIGHFHAAGNPGRRELDTGELDYPRIFAAIDGLGYRGFAGLEYYPGADAAASLRRMRAYLGGS